MFTYLLSYMTPQKMLEMAGEILGEGSHQTTVGEKLLGWGSSLGEMAMILLCALLVSLGIRWFIEKVWKKTSRTATASGHAVFRNCILIQIWFWLFSSFNAIYPQLLLMAVSLTGCYTYLRRDKTEKLFYELILLAFVNYFSVLLLSNWGPMLLVTYLIMGAVAGLVCLGDYWQKENTSGKKAIQILCLILVLGNAFSYTWLILGSQEYHAYVIQNVRGINRGITHRNPHGLYDCIPLQQ